MWGRRSRAAKDEVRNREFVETIMEFLGIFPLRDHPVLGLPYGKRKLVELGRALALEPKLLLLDEPSAGMAAEEKKEFGICIRKIRDEYNATILLIEHDMNMVMGISDTVLAIDQGRVIAKGEPRDVKNNPDVIKAYLGS
jgi:branched-chain amino acid transport system ATP-binding protein